MIYKICHSSIILVLILVISCTNRTKQVATPMKTLFVVEKVYPESEIDGVSVYKIRAMNSMYEDVDMRIVDSVNKFKAGDVVDFYKR